MTLYGRCTTTNITLKSALSNCTTALSEAVAIIYSPTSCQLAKVDQNGDLTNAKNEMISLDNVFELRAFNQNYELRWLNESNGKGKAVLISIEYLQADEQYGNVSVVEERLTKLEVK